jgi:hypothetical protein
VTWLKVDHNFHGHPKVEDVPLSAVGLWVRCGSYTACYELDGDVPVRIARRLGRPRDIAALVDVGLWEPTTTGFVMHDFLIYNPSAAQLARERAAAKQRRERSRTDQLGLFG